MMKIATSLSFFLCLLLSSFAFTNSQGAFGVNLVNIPDEILAAAKSESAEQKLSQKEEELMITLSEIDSVLSAAKSDQETIKLIASLRAEMGDEIKDLQQIYPNLSDQLSAMKEVVDTLKMIDYLFKDKDRAVREMEKEGMIDKKHLSAYQQNPELLENDLRKSLYFQFVSLGVIAGLL